MNTMNFEPFPGTPYSDFEECNDFFDLTPTQPILGHDIDPKKLRSLLQSKFGAGAYSILVIQDCFSIIAPRRLSMDEISKCRRG
ncbi:hypothetical protein BKA66DRAFT_453387 [Pyrenochaeta sp. MPI-SDFR-AT-0127]|nr:hypothetical protein BKA66DRAFT_453387 [Pyrenochaeta sp. MPI-SDFR-AT-0127]